MARARSARPPAVGLRRLALALLLAGLIAAPAAPAAARQGDRQQPAPPQLDAASWLLVDARDGDRLAAHAAAEPRAIATTKNLMTAYIALARLPLDRRLTVPPYSPAPAESVAGLTEGERLSVHDLLLAMMLPSANDAAETVALGLAPSEQAFVARMNDAAADLRLRNTSYANPIGFDDPLNFSTATDLAKLTRELLEDRRFRRIVARPEATLKTGAVRRHVVTRNTLLLTDPSVDGVKTGHTLAAGYVLVASAEREGVPLLSVVLGAPSESARDAETAELLDYGYSLYERRSPFRAGQRLASVSVSYEDEPLAIVAKRPLPITARREESVDVDVRAPVEVEGPISRGERLGRAAVTLEGKPAGSVALVAARAIAAPGLVDRLGGPAVVAAIVAGAVVILLAVALVLRYGHGGQRPEPAARRRT